MNEPQLSAEMERKFDEMNRNCDGAYGTGKFPPEVKHFFATALEEQRAEYEKKVKLQREYVEAGRNGIDRFAEGYISGLDLVLRILEGKK